MLSKSLGALAIVLGLGLVGAAYYSGIGQHGGCGACPLSRGMTSGSDCCSEGDVEDVASTSTQATSDCCQFKAVKVSSCCEEKASATVVAADKAPAAPAAEQKTP